ncbi:hypothetical protein [Phyllobacterium zundukense]|uniref:Uncharacterized protein n=1 Tax=Phyllobacterium zundukense TaxID=1867719 RepID=A0ACD4CXP8_9HYPH|nr:hypothetical protein [Phyllobacterium zundukense]UXN58377.1 hypothetical protein N8E88_09975 [Phyllobacterium zundukense]
MLTLTNWQSVGLLDVVNDALEPFVVTDGRKDRIVINGDNIQFHPKAVLALGIALNELATNAVKYGAFSNGTGSVLIQWKLEPTLEGKELILLWQEQHGPAVLHSFPQGLWITHDRKRFSAGT